MKILVTGATGFLGSHLVKTLLREGHQVAILKRSFSATRRIEDVLTQLACYDLDRSDLKPPFIDHGGFDAVVHVATCYGRRGESLSEIAEANTHFPLRLLETALSFETPCFFSCDTSLPRDLNPYALSKKQFVEWGRMMADRQKIRFVNIVLEHFYGPGDDESKFTTHVVRSCLRNVPELDLTPGDQKRDFIFIGDAVDAFILLLGAVSDRGPGFHEFELGSGKAATVRHFAETVHRLTGSRTRLNFGALPYRPNEVMEACADISSLKQMGWAPRVSLTEGIQKTITGEKNGVIS